MAFWLEHSSTMYKTCSSENFSTIRWWPIATEVYFFSCLHQSGLFKLSVLQDGDSVQAHHSAVWVLTWVLWLAVPPGMVAISVVMSLQSHTGACTRFELANQEAVPVLEWWKAFLPAKLLTCRDNSGFAKGDFLTNTHFLSPWWWLVMGRRALLTWSLHLLEWKRSILLSFQGRNLLDQLRK